MEIMIKVLTVIFSIGYVAIVLYTFYRSFMHMGVMLKNFKPGKSWGQFLAVSIFMDTFFNEEGNIHRVKFMNWATLFIVLCAAPLVIMLVKEHYYF